MEKTMETRKTPLYEKHIEAGARMVEFAGYLMPIQYEGIIAEHELVRTKAGIFDLTHMGEIEVHGENAVSFVDYLITNNFAELSPGRIIYTAICREDGGILDDALAYRTRYGAYLVVNASNKAKIWNWLETQLKKWENVEIRDVSHETALIAVQGPFAENIVSTVLSKDLSGVEYYHFLEGEILGTPGIISRTGYTGEDGFELYIPDDKASELWDRLMEAGRQFGMKPIGLGARDTLRLEAKYALYGNELGEEVNPIEAGIKWVVRLDKTDFIGKEALEKVRDEKPARKLIGFELKKPGVPRHGYKVFDKNDREIGVITSGTHSPTLKKPLGLALVKRTAVKTGDEIQIEIRNRKYPAEVIKTPFYTGTVKSRKKEDI